MTNKFAKHIAEMFGIKQAATEEVQPVAAQETAGDSAEKPHDGPPWVLHIEDDLHFSQALRNRLAAHGVVAVRAFDGMEGFRFAFQYPASVIILDYHLPNGRGDYILRRLKESPATADIPVIMVTGAADKALERRFKAAGAAAFMSKPLDMQKLVEELQKHIDIVSTAEDATPLENAGQKASKSTYSTIA